jgi:UDP-N-acetylglucosamine 4-epimerase
MPLFISKIMKRETVYIDGDGAQTRDFTFVENAVQANIRAMLSDDAAALNQVYNIAVGENFSINRLYSDIEKLLGQKHAATYRESRKGDIRNSLADISKARKLLDYNPEFPFGKGLELTVNYFRELYTK